LTYKARKKLYASVERSRQSRVITYVTGDRQGMETAIGADCVDLFVELLDEIGPTKRISLILHTGGGSTLAAWRIVNLVRTFCEELEVLIPVKALSAGTLISIGADKVVMTKQAALGPIDPSVNSPLNPQTQVGAQQMRVPVSVESVLGYLSAAKDELKLKSEASLGTVLSTLSAQVHPLVLGEIFRARSQIRFLARKLITRQVTDTEKIESIIKFLTADSGSHDYTLNRREARELGLNVETPSDELYGLLKRVHGSYRSELALLEPYTPQAVIGAAPTVNYSLVRGLVESRDGAYGFVSNGTLTKQQVGGPMGMQEFITDQRSFEGWKSLT
jgi:hypothetical protein